MTTPDTHTITDLKGKRVRVVTSGPTHTGVLQGVTDNLLWLAGESEGILRSTVALVAAAPLYCSGCEGETNVLHDDLCASCYRNAAAKQPAHREPCSREGCDKPGIRNPRSGGAGEFLCVLHHAESGQGLAVHPAHADVIAECATEDVSSDKHEWQQVKGSRFRCVRCRTAEKFDSSLLAALSGRV